VFHVEQSKKSQTANVEVDFQTTITGEVPDNGLSVSNLKPVPFNPFMFLSAEEIAECASKFNKQWKGSKSAAIALAVQEFGINDMEACFYVDLKSTATAKIDAKVVTTIAELLINLVPGTTTAAKEISFNLIKMNYEALKPELKTPVGIKVRDWAGTKYESGTAAEVLKPIYNHLGITEKAWMR
jgi:hypothetical protein